MRSLYYVPTVHTVFESSGAKDIPTLSSDEGLAAMLRATEIASCWQKVQHVLERLVRRREIRFKRLYVYVDGLPISLSMARFTKRPDQLYAPTETMMNMLKAHGARIRGTEDIRLIREYALLCQRVRELRVPLKRRTFSRIMQARDKAIAERIAKDLPKDYAALLLMGCAHQTDRYIREQAPDIRIKTIKSFWPLIPEEYRR
jgi:hypothetical protein